MDSTLLLVKCITLLYLESKLKQKNGSKEFCKTIIETIKIPEASVEMHSGAEVILSLRTLILWMVAQDDEAGVDKNQLLQRLRVATKNNVYLYEAVTDGIEVGDDEDEVKKRVLDYRKQLKEHMSNEEIKELLNEAYRKTNFDNKTDFREYVREVYSKLEPYTHDNVDAKHPSVVDSVSFSDAEGIVELMSRSKEEISDAGVLRLGFQGVNRMLGSSRGIRRGEFVLVGALQHNFKTGFTLNIFKHLALYNKPYMRDSNKKPLLVHFSLENELPMNIMWLYANLIENETGVKCDLSDVNVEEAAAYIKKVMGATGYNIEMLRLDPNQTSYFDLLDILLKFESEGYEIHAVVCDYLNMINKNGIPMNGPTGTEIRALFRIMRNFCAPRGIAFITPHQLSTEAKMLVRQGVENFVQEIANKGYYDGSRQIDQEVDLEIFIHIEKVKGVGSFLTCQRGKHRKIEITDNKDLYTVLPFHEVGGVLDDVNGEDLSMSSVGGRSKAAGGEDWFDI